MPLGRSYTERRSLVYRTAVARIPNGGRSYTEPLRLLFSGGFLLDQVPRLGGCGGFLD